MPTTPSSHRRGLRLAPMLAGMALVLGVLAAGALAGGGSPSHSDALDCGGGPVQVIQADGAILPAPPGDPATPAEATVAARRAAQDFLGDVLPGLGSDQVVDARMDAAGISLPPVDGADLDQPDATVATKSGGRVTTVVTLDRDESGRRWAVDRAVVCASTPTDAAAPSDTATGTDAAVVVGSP